MRDPETRQLGRPWQKVVNQGRCKRLTIVIIWAFLEEGCPDALGGTPNRLPVDDHRVDHSAAVFANRVVEDFNKARFGINSHIGRVAGIRKDACVDLWLVGARGFQATWVDAVRELIGPHVPCPADVLVRNTRFASEYPSITEGNVFRADLEQMRRNLFNPPCDGFSGD